MMTMETDSTDSPGNVTSGIAVPSQGLLKTLLLNRDDLPWVEFGESYLQVLQVDFNQGFWVTRSRLKPDIRVPTHYHTGWVLAVTFSGSWYYEEYPDEVNTQGSYLFEPAHSRHTLVSGPEGAEVLFVMTGANINVDENNNITGIVDGPAVLEAYLAACEAEGLATDKVLLIGAPPKTGESQ
jgi:quercetin dioxygenase-like cupin family protein